MHDATLTAEDMELMDPAVNPAALDDPAPVDDGAYHAHLIGEADAAAKFLVAGNAYFTILNTETNKRFTYRVYRDRHGEDVLNVAVFTGSENSNPRHYTFIGTIKDNVFRVRTNLHVAFDLKAAVLAAEQTDEWLLGFVKNIIGRMQGNHSLSDRQVRMFNQSCNRYEVIRPAIPADDVRVRAFAWLWAKHIVPATPFPPQMQFWTEGRCGKCARRLTVPASIAAGFGPECATLLGITLG